MEASGITENAWVVPALDPAIETWLRLGYGPFFLVSVDLPSVRYRSQSIALAMEVAIAVTDHVQIELIQQTSDGPSAFRDMFAPWAGGLHHIRRQPGGYEAMTEMFAAAGTEIVMEMEFGSYRIGFADTRSQLGCMYEILDPSPALANFSEIAGKARIGWDGRNPVRRLDLSDLG